MASASDMLTIATEDGKASISVSRRYVSVLSLTVQGLAVDAKTCVIPATVLCTQQELDFVALYVNHRKGVPPVPLPNARLENKVSADAEDEKWIYQLVPITQKPDFSVLYRLLPVVEHLRLIPMLQLICARIAISIRGVATEKLCEVLVPDGNKYSQEQYCSEEGWYECCDDGGYRSRA